MSGTPSSGRKKSTNRELCFKQYAAGQSLAQISKKTGIDSAQLSRWKAQDEWDKLKREETQGESSLHDIVRQRVIDALKDAGLKPSKWREIADAIKLTENKSTVCPRCASRQEDEKELSQLSNDELDGRIEELQRFIASAPKEPPQLQTNETKDEIETNEIESDEPAGVEGTGAKDEPAGLRLWK